MKDSRGVWHSTEPIRAVGFDLWETLITNSHEASRQQELSRIRKLGAKLRELGIDVTEDRVTSAHKETWQRCHDLYWSRDVDVPTIQQLLHFAELLACEVDEEQLLHLEEIYATALLDHPPELVDDAREVLETLKARGYATGLISNTGRTPGKVLRRLLDDFGLSESLDAMVFSNEHLVCKPQRPLFDALAQALSLSPQSIAFIGDNRDADVFGAVKSGMFAIHFARASKGTAFAPELDRGEVCEPHATITSLAQLPGLLTQLAS